MMHPAAGAQRGRLTLAALYSVVVFLACSIPGDSLPMSLLWSRDKLWHLVAFAALAILWRRAGAGALAAGLGGFVFGAGIEVWQQFAPIGRFFDELDIVANAAGLLIGLTAWAAIDLVVSRRTPLWPGKLSFVGRRRPHTARSSRHSPIDGTVGHADERLRGETDEDAMV